jgi:hypothetical protein
MRQTFMLSAPGLIQRLGNRQRADNDGKNKDARRGKHCTRLVGVLSNRAMTSHGSLRES